jgi:hypothetical protein
MPKEKAWGMLEGIMPSTSASKAQEESWNIVKETLEKNKRDVSRARQIVQEFNAKVQKARIYGTDEKKEVIPQKDAPALPTFEEIRAELTAQGAKVNTQTKQEIQSILTEYEPLLTSKEYKALRTDQTITTAAIQTPEVPMAVFIDAVERGYDANRAAQFAYTATVVNSQTTGAAGAKAAEAIGDVVYTVFPNLRYASAERIAASAWERVTNSDSKIAEIADRIGEGVAQSDQFKDFIRRGNAYAASHSSGGLGNIVSGIASNMRISDEQMVDYMEVLYKKNSGATINPTELFAGHGLHISHFEIGGLSDWVTEWIARKKAGSITRTALSVGAKTSAKEVGIALLSRLGLKGLGATLGGPVGWVALLAGDKLIDLGGKALAGLQSLTPGAIINSIVSGKPDDLSKTFALFPVVLTVVLVLFFIFPWPLNVYQFPDNVRRTALVTQGGGEVDPIPSCIKTVITATPNPPTGTPTSIQYTVSVSSTCSGDLDIQNAVVSFTIFGGTGTIAPHPISSSDLQDGSYTFTIPVGSQFNNTVVTGTITVTGSVGEDTATGTGSVSTIIGTPPTGCFVLAEPGGSGYFGNQSFTSSAWGSDAQKMLVSIAELAASTSYMDLLCKNNIKDGPIQPISLYRVRTDFGGGLTNGANAIFLFDVCFRPGSTQACLTYTLAHETGHIINNRPTDTYDRFHAEGIAREGFLWTYVNAYTEREDFAETFGAYVIWRRYSFRGLSRQGVLNYPAEYPRHYKFAKDIFKIEY